MGSMGVTPPCVIFIAYISHAGDVIHQQCGSEGLASREQAATNLLTWAYFEGTDPVQKAEQLLHDWDSGET